MTFQKSLDRLSDRANVMQRLPKGEFQPAKQEPYYPVFVEKVQCFLGFHHYAISAILRGTKECYKCGKRKVSLKHY